MLNDAGAKWSELGGGSSGVLGTGRQRREIGGLPRKRTKRRCSKPRTPTTASVIPNADSPNDRRQLPANPSYLSEKHGLLPRGSFNARRQKWTFGIWGILSKPSSPLKAGTCHDVIMLRLGLSTKIFLSLMQIKRVPFRHSPRGRRDFFLQHDRKNHCRKRGQGHPGG